MTRARSLGVVLLLVSCPPGEDPNAMKCGMGYTNCGGTCVQLASNAAHCGGCGNACGDGQACADSQCRPANCPSGPCWANEACLGRLCVDRACVGILCPQGRRCVAGQCVAPDCPSMTCGGYRVCVAGGCVDSSCYGQCPDAGCVRGACVKPSCSDGLQNGDETDLDCGGSCPPCAWRSQCTGARDCLSGSCDGGRCASAASCANGVQDRHESGVDCGGPDCGPCGAGERCRDDSDCLGFCGPEGICVTGGCADGRKSSGESDVDCGAVCAASGKLCANGRKCVGHEDCAQRRCEGGTCLMATCSDSLADGVESDVDCGGGDGGCTPCPNGALCFADDHCDSGYCNVVNRCE